VVTLLWLHWIVAVALVLRLAVLTRLLPPYYFGFQPTYLPEVPPWSAAIVVPVLGTLLALWVPVGLASRLRTTRPLGLVVGVAVTLSPFLDAVQVLGILSALIPHEPTRMAVLHQLWNLSGSSVAISLVSLSCLYLWFSRDVRAWLAGSAPRRGGG
jgi:hypothetical protein